MSLKEMLSIMVVDDHISSRMLTVDALKEMGITNLHIAKDGREAFTKLANCPVHLLITDLYMPEIDGFKLIQAVRTNPSIKGMAIIILTGKKDANVVNIAGKLGVNNVLSKPFSSLQLKDAIESIVGRLN